MTLLVPSDLDSVEARLPVADERCRALTGRSVYEVGCIAADVEPMSADEMAGLRVAAVPVTAGGGLIGSFSSLVSSIVSQLAGVGTFTTTDTDVTGLREALLGGADIVFMADDDTFIALDARNGRHSDNSLATGRAFATLLELSAGTIESEILVLGAGRVGIGAMEVLTSHSHDVRWYDTDPSAGAGLDTTLRVPDWRDREWRYVVECTTSAGIVDAPQLADGAIVAAPGMPLGITPAATARAAHVIHDELETGVVAMLCEVMHP